MKTTQSIKKVIAVIFGLLIVLSAILGIAILIGLFIRLVIWGLPVISCKQCSVEESPTWWKCCSTHTPELGLDVVCQTCANKCIPPLHDDHELLVALEVQLKDMEIPKMRRDLSKTENIRWLWRNIPFRNLNHPNREPAMLIIYEILHREKH